ncbi:hypothetical protein E3N88_16482 [Mikania micrantha]|uniref:Uncharacterized protein n=1 Tax=Mikania micrantha TaxID=192012 RepID=A0A5N6NYX4_9ASTR|nr:hypothetical protein E3N88_16482 [Mikania micrantha]
MYTTFEDLSFKQHVDIQEDVHIGGGDGDYGNFDNPHDYIAKYFTKDEVIPLSSEYDDANGENRAQNGVRMLPESRNEGLIEKGRKYPGAVRPGPRNHLGRASGTLKISGDLPLSAWYTLEHCLGWGDAPGAENRENRLKSQISAGSFNFYASLDGSSIPNAKTTS